MGGSADAPDDTSGQVNGGEDSEEEAETAEEESDEEGDIEARLATYRRRIKPSDCLFCTTRTSTPDEAAVHMSRVHGFFIPDRDHLVDLSGLLSYLGEKIIIGNLCLYCPNGGKEFGSVDAVRRHMTDKGHCKMAYDSNEDRAEVLDFYDYEVAEDEWEDVDGEGEEGDVEGEEVVSDLLTKLTRQSGDVSLAPDGLSLILPSGRVLGHRSLKVYYDQNFRPATARKPVDDKVKRVRERLADPTLALVPIAGGSGGFGRGLQVVKARNAGEAKWARKQGRSFNEQRRRTDHATRVGFVHNNQKRESIVSIIAHAKRLLCCICHMLMNRLQRSSV